MLNHLGFFFFLLFFSFFFLRLGLGQRRALVIIGRWLLPSLVDTGDICCHYWQHILVIIDIDIDVDININININIYINIDINTIIIFQSSAEYVRVCSPT